MTKQFAQGAWGWGFALWFIGYLLGMIFFAVLPANLIGWAIMPIGIALTLWVLMKKIKSQSLAQYLSIAVVWTLIAVVADYLFLVKLLQPVGGYYKLDVYLYYALTFSLPLLVGWYKIRYKK